MSVLSKTLNSFIAEMINLITCEIPMQMSNARLWKKPRNLDYLGNLIAIAHPVNMDDNTVTYSRQKKCEASVLKGVLNSNPLQKLNIQDGRLESSKLNDKILLLAIWSYFLGCGLEIEYLMEAIMANVHGVVNSQQATISDPFSRRGQPDIVFAKYSRRSRKFRDIPRILVTFYLQMKVETRKLPKYIEDPQKSAILDPFRPQVLSETRVLKNPELLKFPEITVSDASSYDLGESQLTDPHKRRDSLKHLKMCYLCQETISEKKFFGERRYAILSNCDCLICYGCIRKTVLKDGSVNASVFCPSCSVKSDMVAASNKWIERKDKLGFFRTFIQNTKTIHKARKDIPAVMERMTSVPGDKQLGNCMKHLSHLFIWQ